MILEDGSSHAVDSSDMAFQICARDAFKEVFLKSKPALLEPIMQVQVETPTEFQGTILGDLSARRGIVQSTETRGPLAILSAEVPLARMFGYATDVRSLSQGKATFTMEFLKYKRVPHSVQEEIVAAAGDADAVIAQTAYQPFSRKDHARSSAQAMAGLPQRYSSWSGEGESSSNSNRSISSARLPYGRRSRTRGSARPIHGADPLRRRDLQRCSDSASVSSQLRGSGVSAMERQRPPRACGPFVLLASNV